MELGQVILTRSLEVCCFYQSFITVEQVCILKYSKEGKKKGVGFFTIIFPIEKNKYVIE